MLYFTPCPLLLGTAVLIVLLHSLRRKDRSSPFHIRFSVFWGYLLLVAKVTLFPIPIEINPANAMTQERLLSTLSRINLIPFHYAGFFNKYVVFIEITRNILLTIPLGFGVNFIARLEPKNILGLAAATGFWIEAAQLVVSLGIGGNYRTVDITDVILNAAGVLLA